MRIRSIKPEFFDSPSTAACTPWARLLYIAMWCMADDWGVGSANPKEMAANAFPNDDQWTSKELPSLCKEVADNFGVLFYMNRGRPYFQIPTWDEHQVTQRRAKRRYPTFDDEESTPDLGVPELPSVRKEVPCVDKENASTEQGNRGTGEQGNRGTGEQVVSSRKRRVIVDPPAFADFWAAYPRKTAKGAAREAWAMAITKTDEGIIVNAARAYATDPNLPADQTKIPHASTWLNQERWEDGPQPTQARPRSRTSEVLDGAEALIARYQREEQGWTDQRQLDS